jgi:hypothetical protein
MKKYTIAAFLFVCNISLAQSPSTNPPVNPAANPSENPTAPSASNPVARPSASEPKTPEQIAKRLLQDDKNGDGKLSQDELPQQLRQAFEAMDTNHDGLLDESEVLAFSKMMASREARRGSGGGAQNFEGAMKQTNRGFKALEKSTFDPAGKAQDLASIQMVQAGLLAAKGMISTVKMAPQAKEKYGTDTAKFESDMRSQLLASLTVAIALENAVIRGDAAGAKELVSKLDAEEEEGHEMFRPQENEENEEKGEKSEKGERAPATSTAPKAPTAPTVPAAPTNSPK